MKLIQKKYTHKWKLNQGVRTERSGESLNSDISETQEKVLDGEVSHFPV
jgi:hypothetical protein